MVDANTQKEIRAAIKQGNLSRVQELIGSDIERLQMSTPFGTWLHVASSFGKRDIVEWLVKMGADVNARGGIAGGNALHRAASDGHLETVAFLLRHGAEMDTSEPERNPLFGAIYGGHTGIAKLLINAGIDTSVRYTGDSMKEMDALAYAREWGRNEIAALLHGN